MAEAFLLGDDHVALPVSGHRAVGGHGGPLGDVDHVGQDPVLALGALTIGDPKRPSGAQTHGKLSTQGATRLHVERLVDGLG